MEVYALIGHSGTGKSHHAPMVAHRKQINYIIDDGLLIKGSLVVAGRSAKRETTRFGAVKRALFNDPDHADQIIKKLEELRPEKILILSTSRRMSVTITQRLGLPRPAHYLTIEEVSTPESIERALRVREAENRHVIPLPTFTIKKEFPGYLIDPLRSFFTPPAQKPLEVERSIVRPIYSSLGNFYIAEHVVSELAGHILEEIPGIHKAQRVYIVTVDKKVKMNVDLILNLAEIPHGQMVTVLKKAQVELKEQIEYLTGFYLDRINVTAKKIYLGGQEPYSLPQSSPVAVDLTAIR